ncbi:uncharacterized protein L969DRAFT_87898 [Mixia osmundae IAM 14324]|uniref:PAN2-PAN3 deadenylation complex catalytic subunit PAN2 n=1 Tax=Mixia osmundae (strain CBS 9802 / IAM 14324 / JCM 22182 / KY 12970) TaxID=764103 RepID=G7E233_MIXOS|nr:uncharacterized protein L969DRAFT_87898 [Mixia osmundae IAM 14324]KEI38672.1 hypothetical protein L969DRAFT_87898 [Mixia osmundae IAM 14324]GAA96870.1 hypothetical protein E5Q_03543 [Mixia osmundae IAM 14324]
MEIAWHETGQAGLGDLTSLCLDTHQALLWTGTPHGHIASFFTDSPASQGNENEVPPAFQQRYTAFKGSSTHEPIKELWTDEAGVLSLASDGVKLTHRRGLTLWNTLDPTHSLVSMAYSSLRASEIVAGGSRLAVTSQGSHVQPLVGEPDLLLLSASTGTIIRRVPSSIAVQHLRTSHQNVVLGSAEGRVHLLDPKSLKTQSSIDAHSAGLSVLEAEGHLLYTGGFSLKQGRPVPDPLVKVFDVRMLRPLVPVPFPAGPAFIKPHPRLSTTIAVSSLNGSFQIVDTLQQGTVQFHQLPFTSYLTAMSMAPSGEGLLFADQSGLVRLWSSSDDAKYTRYGPQDIELPDPVEPPKQIEWTPSSPLSLIGVPFYDTQLLSVIPIENYATKYSAILRPPTRPDPALHATLKQVDWIGYAVNPKGSIRNLAVAHDSRAKQASNRRMDVPLFRSEKEKIAQERRRRARASTDNANASVSLEDEESELTSSTMPKYYSRVEIKYSRFGVEDFDFGFYNKTRYSGLETHIVNSYTNSFLQVLRFIKPLAALALAHILVSCPKEDCLLCEAGFLFKQLQDAQGVNCQASNFSRAFSASRQAEALGLMDHSNESAKTAYASLIQTFNRFMIEQLGQEAKVMHPDLRLRRHMVLLQEESLPSPVSQIFGISARTMMACVCGAQSSRDSSFSVIDLIYPRKALSNEPKPASDFHTILKASIGRETATRATCAACRQFAHARVRRVLTNDLPPVVTINANVNTADHMEMWLDGKTSKDRFLQPSFVISRGMSGLSIQDEASSIAADTDSVCYQLTAIVCQIQSDDDPAHLISLIRIPREEDERAGTWHLFNDFLVKAVSEDEALGFPGSWKIPAVLCYTRIDASRMLDLSVLPTTLDTSILERDLTISRRRDPSKIKHEVLSASEIPRKGMLVSIDAEFVSLQQEEVEYRSDGTRSVLRPSRMTLARVSVLRGEGAKTGVPFIDDHISTTEPIVDHLTEYSGIRPGDLDPFVSPHTLVSLKAAYKKLRMLVDLGCVFIGHGLQKDFRIINIFVPPGQIIDTVNIYHLAARHRKLSLRFLSFVVLQQDIQSGTHDSIEDARTALQLYEEYRRLEAQGSWEDRLDEIYVEGKRLNFKVPQPEAAAEVAMDLSSQNMPAASVALDARIASLSSASPIFVPRSTPSPPYFQSHQPKSPRRRHRPHARP